MNRKGLVLTLAAVALAPIVCKMIKKFNLSRKPIVVLDVDAVTERSLPGRAASQYLRTVKGMLERNVEDVRKIWRGREQTPEAVRAIAQANATFKQQMIVYQNKLEEEMQSIVHAAVRDWLGKNRRVSGVMPTSEVVGFNKNADITNQIMAMMDWYKPSLPPLPRTKSPHSA